MANLYPKNDWVVIKLTFLDQSEWEIHIMWQCRQVNFVLSEIQTFDALDYKFHVSTVKNTKAESIPLSVFPLEHWDLSFYKS